MKNTHLFFDVFVVVVDTLALVHLSGLRCKDGTHVDPGMISGCHSNMPERSRLFFFLTFSFIYLLFYLFRSFRSFQLFRFGGFVLVVSVVSFRSFRSFWWFGFGRFVSLFRVLVHALKEILHVQFTLEVLWK